jgi:hypothetical protein
MRSEKEFLFLLKTIDLLVAAMKLPQEAALYYAEARASMHTMIKENRRPTVAEWDDLERNIRMLKHEVSHPELVTEDEESHVS